MNCKVKIFAKKASSILIIYFILMTVFTGMMTATYSIGSKEIIEHTRESIPILQKEGVYPRILIDSNKSQLDNFTDSWMLSIAMGVEGENALNKAMNCSYNLVEDSEEKLENLIRFMNGEKNIVSDYNRYWHGYQVVLRPLLKIFNYEEIRYLNMFGIIGLFIVSANLINKKINRECFIAYIISILMSMIIIVPMSLQFSSIFYITFISIIILTTFSKSIMKKDLMYVYFFLIGALTSFFDLLTAPLITLGFSIIIYFYLELKESNIKRNILEIISKSMCWSMGYLMSWSGKWFIAQIITKKDVISNALNKILSRTSNQVNDITISKFEVVLKNIAVYLNNINIKIILVIFISLLLIAILLRKSNIMNISPIILISIYPIVWYILLANHSYMHFWFTYRNLSISAFSILSFIFY